MTSFILFLLCLGVSSCILVTMWILIMQQLCNAKLYERTRLYRISLLCILSTFAVLNNGLLYLWSLYPHYLIVMFNIGLWVITYIIEGIAVIIGYHTFCVFQMTIIKNMYVPLNMSPPKWIKNAMAVIEFAYIAAAFICYALLIKNKDPDKYAQIFYVILNGVVCIQSCIASILFFKLLSTLNECNIDNSDDMYEKIQTAKHRVQFGIFLDLVICIVCLFSMTIATDFLWNYLHISFNHKLLDCTLHSVFLIFILISLYLWIYQSTYCCELNTGTVCDNCGCNEVAKFWCPCCTRRRKRKRKTPREEVLLHDSTTKTHSIQDGIRKVSNGTNSKLTEWHASLPHGTVTLTLADQLDANLLVKSAS